MKVLILSNSEWDDSNSFGSSFSNILGDIAALEIANVYCRSAVPNTRSCKLFFQITEKMLLKNLQNSRYPAGRRLAEKTFSPDAFSDNEKNYVSFVQKKRWLILFWIRDLIWFFGRWKSKELKQFIDDFKPDLIFLPVYYSVYLNKIGLFLQRYSGKPMVGYISDDNYSLRQFSLSPFFWIDRFIKRKWVKKAIDKCRLLYVISDVQKKDYDHLFNKDCKILYKGGNFSTTPHINQSYNNPLQFIYAGNLGAGRWKTLVMTGEALSAINENGVKAILNIYSATPLSTAMGNAFTKNTAIHFHGKISMKEVFRLQREGDVVLHVESFNLKDKLQTRQSFSTKIVDYFQNAACIFAAGWHQAASVKYLYNNNAAIVATDAEEIKTKLAELVHNPHLIPGYRLNAWQCGKKNHEISRIHESLLRDLEIVAGKITPYA